MKRTPSFGRKLIPRSVSPVPEPPPPRKNSIDDRSSSELPTLEKAPNDFFCDVVLVEGKWFASKKVSERKLYISMSLESSDSSTSMGKRFATSSFYPSDHMVWNSDATFVLQDLSSKLHVVLMCKKTVVGKFTVDLQSFATKGVFSNWYNFRSVYEAVNVEDLPVRNPNDQNYLEGFCSFGYVSLKLEVSNRPSNMMLSNFGNPLRALPIRVKTGDLLFFSNRSFKAKSTKVVTHSLWDHMAIFLSYKHYKKMYILQSTTSGGVEVAEAEGQLRGFWHSKSATRVGVRRLHHASAAFAVSLSEFAEKNVGKSYNYNVLSLLGGTKRKSHKELKSTEKAESEKLFCSELVAAAYLSVGVLGPKTVPSNFSPASFADSQLQTEEGYELSKLYKFKKMDSKSLDCLWASRETRLKETFRNTITGGGLSNAAEEDVKMLKKIRQKQMVTSMYERKTEEQSELSFAEDDKILVLEKDASGWWVGQHQTTGNIGLFPANFCTEKLKQKVRRER